MIKSHSRFALLLLAAALAMVPLGCDPGLSPVTGTVTYQGKPAVGAAVHFRPEGSADDETVVYPIGIVDAEGKYVLETPNTGKGAAPGKYRVLIRWSVEKDPNAPPPKKKSKLQDDDRKNPESDSDRLKYRYFNPAKPLLRAEVKPGVNNLDVFELKD
jgi:hypothetical protein